MAELRVKISADVREAKKLTRSLKEIKKAAGLTAGSLEATSAAASKTSVSLQTTVSASGQLAVSQNLAATANVAVAKTLGAVAAKATATTVAEKAATTQTNILSASLARLGAIGQGAFLKVGAGAKRFGTQMRTAAGSVIGASTAAAGFGAVVAVGIGSGIKSAVEFEKTFSRIEGLVGVARQEVEAFKKPVLDIAKATAKGPNELAEALFFITSAGFKGSAALDVLEASARAAAAGLGETKQVADAVTSAVNAYGIENLTASRATDILVATVKEGKAEADSIAGSLGQILPIASELGVGFEELGGVLAALTRIGLGADQGATALGATLNAIQKPGAEARAELIKFGTSASELRKKVDQDGLLAALQDLTARFGDNEDALTRVFPNIRGLRAILPLVGKNAGDVATIFENVADSVGATDAAFEAYTNTTAFELSEALVVLQVSLQKIGDELLPAVAKAFVTLAQGVERTVDGMQGLGELLANAIGGSDDPLVQARERVFELAEAVEFYESKESAFAKKRLAFFGVDLAGVELSGTFEENLAVLRKELDTWEEIVSLNEKATLETIRRNDALEDQVEIVDEISETPPAKVIDEALLAKGKKGFENLRDEVAFLQGDLTNLQELGQEGIGLQEDFTMTKEIVDQLQGELGITAAQVRQLVNDKRELTDAITAVNEEFIKQDAATDFLDDLVTDTELLVQKFDALSASGGNLFDIDSLQQAQAIFNDLSDEDKELFGGPEAIQQQIQLQAALNSAIGAIPVDKVAALNTQLETLQMANIDPDSGFFGQLEPQIRSVEQAMVDAQLKAAGLGSLGEMMLEALPKQDQIDAAIAPFKQMLADGLLEPEQFALIVDNIEAKINGLGDTMSEFAIQAARNLQTAFADFLFDPLADGFDGMLRGFTETLRRMASEALAAAAIQQMINALTNFGGGGNTSGFGGFLNAIGGAFGGGMADGGRAQGNETLLVGERGPELFTPGQSGNIVSNEMMRGQANPAPQVNVSPAPVIVVDDPSKVEKALQSANGQRALVEAVTEKRGAIKQALQ